MAQEVQRIARERFYDNQLLHVQDFEREQAFHVGHRELQTRLCYTAGILAGLAVRNGPAAGQVVVLSGVAIDGTGRQIVLAAGARFGTSDIVPQGGSFTLDLNKEPGCYAVGEEKKWALTLEADPTPDPKDNQWIERPKFSLIRTEAAPEASQVVLARIGVNATETTDTSSGKPVKTITLAVQIDSNVQVPARLSPERLPPVSADKIQGKLDPEVIPDLDAGQIKSGKLRVSVIPDIDAGKISTGKLVINVIPDLDAAQIKTGKLSRTVIPTLGADSIPDLDAAKIKSGRLSLEVIPDLDAAKIKSGRLSLEVIPDLDASLVKTGRFRDTQIPDLSAAKITSGKLSATVIPGLDAGQITSGVLSADRLPPDLLPPDQRKPKWQATIARPGGTGNRVRFCVDLFGFVHLSGSINPVFSQLSSGTKDLLQLPDNCIPSDTHYFVILDSKGEPWRLEVPTKAGQSMSAFYLGHDLSPADRSLSFAGLNYALSTS